MGLLRTTAITKVRERINDTSPSSPNYSDTLIGGALDAAQQYLASLVANYHPNYYLTISELLASNPVDTAGEFFALPANYKTGAAFFQKLTPSEDNSVRYRLINVNGWDAENYRFYWGTLYLQTGITGYGTCSVSYTADGDPLLRILPAPEDDFVYDIYYLRWPVAGATYIDVPLDWTEAVVLYTSVQLLQASSDSREGFLQQQLDRELQIKQNEFSRQRSMQQGTIGWGRYSTYGRGWPTL